MASTLVNLICSKNTEFKTEGSSICCMGCDLRKLEFISVNTSTERSNYSSFYSAIEALSCFKNSKVL